MVSGVGGKEAAAPPGPAEGFDRDRRLTALALFEDAIDAEAALRTLERGSGSAAQVSLLVRARSVEPDDLTDRSGAVARSLVAVALENVGGWLLGLTAVLDHERGAYLVAGPLGAALAAAVSNRAEPEDEPQGDPANAGLRPSDVETVAPVLTDFGFVPEEATYLDRRIAAGAVLIAVTTVDPREIVPARQLFSDHDAIYIGHGQSESRPAAEATAAIAALLRAAGDSGDEPALPPLQRVCREPVDHGDALCGTAVVDRFGDDAGTIDDLLVDDRAESGDTGPVVRYVIVEFGGLLGLGRQHVAVPADLVDRSTQPVGLSVDRKVLHHAPRLAADGVLTRRGQLAVCAFFGLRPYWLRGDPGRRVDG